MTYNDAESVLKAAEEVWPEVTMALVSGLKYDEDNMETDGDGEPQTAKPYRSYSIEVNLGGSGIFAGQRPWTKDDINAINRVVKKSEVKCTWTIETNGVATFDIE